MSSKYAGKENERIKVTIILVDFHSPANRISSVHTHPINFRCSSAPKLRYSMHRSVWPRYARIRLAIQFWWRRRSLDDRQNFHIELHHYSYMHRLLFHCFERPANGIHIILFFVIGIAQSIDKNKPVFIPFSQKSTQTHQKTK